MAKCLRCGAGSEWIQGRVPLEKDLEIQVSHSFGIKKPAMEDNDFRKLCVETVDCLRMVVAENERLAKENAQLRSQLNQLMQAGRIALVPAAMLSEGWPDAS